MTVICIMGSCSMVTNTGTGTRLLEATNSRSPPDLGSWEQRRALIRHTGESMFLYMAPSFQKYTLSSLGHSPKAPRAVFVHKHHVPSFLAGLRITTSHTQRPRSPTWRCRDECSGLAHLSEVADCF